jgi:hypothetical protein
MTDYRVQFVNWENPTSNQSGWRAEMKCEVCKVSQTFSAEEPEDQTLDEAIKRLKIFLERPLCMGCEEKLTKYNLGKKK